MSNLFNYYLENNQKISMHDLNQTEQKLQITNANIYFAQSPMGYYQDLGEQRVGQRPVNRRYEVGNFSCITPNNRRPDVGVFGCRQPVWASNCW